MSSGEVLVYCLGQDGFYAEANERSSESLSEDTQQFRLDNTEKQRFRNESYVTRLYEHTSVVFYALVERSRFREIPCKRKGKKEKRNGETKKYASIY